jgi:hypothetical protein
MLADLNGKRESLSATLLRIEGAMQVLRELLSTASRNFVPIWPRIHPAGLRCSSVTWFTMRPRRALPGGRLRVQLDTNLRGAVLSAEEAVQPGFPGKPYMDSNLCHVRPSGQRTLPVLRQRNL